MQSLLHLGVILGLHHLAAVVGFAAILVVHTHHEEICSHRRDLHQGQAGTQLDDDGDQADLATNPGRVYNKAQAVHVLGVPGLDTVRSVLLTALLDEASAIIDALDAHLRLAAVAPAEIAAPEEVHCNDAPRLGNILQLQRRVRKLEKLEKRDALVKVAGVWRRASDVKLGTDAGETDAGHDHQQRFLQTENVLDNSPWRRVRHVVISQAGAPSFHLAVVVRATSGMVSTRTLLRAVRVDASAHRLPLHRDSAGHDEGARRLDDRMSQVDFIKSLSILIEALGLKLGDDGTITRFLEGVSALDVKNNDLNVQND
mmetsp:Transcript_33916/g.78919  ORF Transcript_33916/g.78919 Transcript_33916/m.78919 type:complete len:314 (-) Transcript_33916:210-1151(-)